MANDRNVPVCPNTGIFVHPYNSIYNKMLTELYENIRMLTMDTVRSGCYEEESA